MTAKQSAIEMQYDPEAVIGEWGWIWSSEDDEWLLVVTYEHDEDATLRITGWNLDRPYDGVSPEYDAEDWRGVSYIPLSRPACEPGAHLLVTVLLPDGASVAHSWGAPGLETDAARDRIMAALLPGPGEERP